MPEFFDHTLSDPEEQAADYFLAHLPTQYSGEVPHPLDVAAIAVMDELGRIQEEVDNPNDVRPETADLRVALAYDGEVATAPALFPRSHGLQPRTMYIDPASGNFQNNASHGGPIRSNPNDPYSSGLL